MPSLDIWTLIKDVFSFFKLFRSKLFVVKHMTSAEHDTPLVVFTNVSHNPITIVDAGFSVNGDLYTFAGFLFKTSTNREMFPQTIEVGASLSFRITPGAHDMWERHDVYTVDSFGRTVIYKAKPQLSAAR